jgi:hypothetical protein
METKYHKHKHSLTDFRNGHSFTTLYRYPQLAAIPTTSNLSYTRRRPNGLTETRTSEETLRDGRSALAGLRATV